MINWKELVDAETQARLDAELAAAVRTAPKAVTAAPVWADGPSAGFDAPVDAGVDDLGDFADLGDLDDATLAPGYVPSSSSAVASLGDRLMLAQQTAAAVRAADTRSRATLYRALERAHDFAAAADQDPAGYEALLDQAGIAVQLRAPMTPVVKLVFGSDYDKTRLTEYAAVLSHARRHGVPAGGLGAFLEQADGGIKGVVKAERAARAPLPVVRPDAAGVLRGRPALATVSLGTDVGAGDYVVLLARAGDAGTLDIVAALGGDSALTQRVMRQAAR